MLLKKKEAIKEENIPQIAEKKDDAIDKKNRNN